jgi:hypothetical protein
MRIRMRDHESLVNTYENRRRLRMRAAAAGMQMRARVCTCTYEGMIMIASTIASVVSLELHMPRSYIRKAILID